jgi:hypothetical protein
MEQELVGTLSSEIREFINHLPVGPARTKVAADLDQAEAARRQASADAHTGAHATYGPLLAAHERIFSLARQLLQQQPGAGRGGKR